MRQLDIMLPTTFLPSILRTMERSTFTKLSSALNFASSNFSKRCFSASAIRFDEDKRPLGPGRVVPKFMGKAVVDGEIKTIAYEDKSADYQYAGKWLIFFFYPLDFTFVCPTEIIAFSERAAEFRKKETELIACSCDSHFSHLAWVNTSREDGGLGKMNIPILSDYNKQIATDFGVLDKSTGIPYRITKFHKVSNFCPQIIMWYCGLIRHTLVNDLPIGRSVDEALRILNALKYFEEHGEVCPADWEEGDDTIDRIFLEQRGIG
ncbi:Thioredoxin domain-containing protein [Meloidogyne graminicola]|uniref:thioredoxin-dependent peroxiredoxin n=1 Tax=Meloidogyne graminicola TaxID=189291 RepID=A0A8S9Z7N7_9BILA|nr:Thioredoxin domain-containing protein [Meloidogyne graminicola]